ncbi:MAG: hypothetical protein ACJ8KF_01625 [Chthoniobacterales bacterium]
MSAAENPAVAFHAVPMQGGQVGASAWIAHAKLSKAWRLPAIVTSKLLS